MNSTYRVDVASDILQVFLHLICFGVQRMLLDVRCTLLAEWSQVPLC